MMETEPVETVQRVTDDTTRQKDPRKVEAGRRGAAARKAKEEGILAELREAKTGLQKVEPLPEIPKPVQPRTNASIHDWTPYIIGGIGVIAYLWYNKTHGQPVTPPAPAKQLDTRQDPFHMQ